MFRYEDGSDITDEEFETLVEPFEDACNRYLLEDVIPEYIAFYLATGVRMKSLWRSNYRIHINSAANMFNLTYDYETIKIKVTNILAEKYHLRVISEEPLELELTTKPKEI